MKITIKQLRSLIRECINESTDERPFDDWLDELTVLCQASKEELLDQLGDGPAEAFERGLDPYDYYSKEAKSELSSSAGPEREICSMCNGSGEGMADGTRCRTCKGSGEVYGESVD